MFDRSFDSPPESFDRLPLSKTERLLLDLPAESAAGIPEVLDDMDPGPGLAAVLGTIDPGAVSGYARVLLLRAQQKLVSHHHAGFYGAISAVSEHMLELDGDYELANEAAALEIRAALRLTRRSADSELDLAYTVHQHLPKVGKALADGDIDVRRARVISYGTCHLGEEQAREVVDRVISDAGRMTSGQLHARIHKLCFQIDPEESKTRYQQGLEERRVVKAANDTGTADLLISNVAPDRAAAAYANIDHIAKSLRGVDEERSIDQLRSDVALDLLAGRIGHKTTGRGTVDLHVDLTTLTELSETPGELAGFGPVIADIARQVTEQQKQAEWRYTITDPETGMVIHNGTTRRRPNTEQKRHVAARNRTCVFPGCRMPVQNCDLDHRKPWAETHHTTVEELSPLCRHDHCKRHQHGWTYRPLPGGDYLWTSRLGHTYTTSGRPPP